MRMSARAGGFVLESSLHDFSIEDLQQRWGDPFRYIASSIPLEDLCSSPEKGAMGDDLVRLTFDARKKSPADRSMEQMLSINFDSLFLTGNRETIAALAILMIKILRSDDLKSTQEKSQGPSIAWF